MDFCRSNSSNKPILKLLVKRYDETHSSFKTSEEFSDLLQTTERKLRDDMGRFFVHLRDFLAILKEHKHVRHNHDMASDVEKSAESLDEDCDRVETDRKHGHSTDSDNDSEYGNKAKRRKIDTGTDNVVEQEPVESTKEAWLNQDCLINNEEENDKTVKNDDGDHIDEDVATVRSADLDVKRNNDEIEHSGVEVTRTSATDLIVVQPFQCSSEAEDTNAQSANLPTDKTQKISEVENCRKIEQLLDNTDEKKCESDFENVNTESDIVKESPSGIIDIAEGQNDTDQVKHLNNESIIIDSQNSDCVVTENCDIPSDNKESPETNAVATTADKKDVDDKEIKGKNCPTNSITGNSEVCSVDNSTSNLEKNGESVIAIDLETAENIRNKTVAEEKSSDDIKRKEDSKAECSIEIISDTEGDIIVEEIIHDDDKVEKTQIIDDEEQSKKAENVIQEVVIMSCQLQNL